MPLAQHPIRVRCALNLRFRQQGLEHASPVLEDAIPAQKAPVRAQIARHALQGSSYQTVVWLVLLAPQESLPWRAHINAVICVK